MTQAEPFEPGPNSRGLFALVVGLYAAATLAPAATFSLAAGDPAWQVYTTLLGNVFVVTVLVGVIVASDERSLAIRLGRTRLSWGLAAAGLPYAGWLFAISPGEGGPVLLAMLGLFGSVTAGLVCRMMARNRAINDRLSGRPVRARWEAPAPPARHRRAVGLGIAALVGGFVLLAVGSALGNLWLRFVGQLVGPLTVAVAVGTVSEREYLVVDEGLVVRAPANLRLLPWDRFEGVSVTDDALVLHRASHWRPNVYSDRAKIEDVDAVREALETSLSRR